MQTVKYNLKMNGWSNQMKIHTQPKPQIDADKINVRIVIVGVAECNALLNIRTGELVTETKITMRPYESNGKDKEFTKFKIPKLQLLQIRDYIS